MGVLVVFEDPKTFEYRSKLCSWASFITLILLLFTILPPLFVVVFTDDFLQSIGRRNEKPAITFKYSMLCRLNIDDYGNYITWSTFQNHINSDFSKLRHPTFLKAEEKDTNADGLQDQLDLKIVFPLRGNEEVSKVDFLLVFEYQLKEIIKFKMESMAHITYSYPVKGNNLKVIGSLGLVQNIPIHFNFTSFEKPIINENSSHPASFDVSNILNSYNSRMIRTEVREGLFAMLSYDESLGRSFSFQLQLKYPVHFNILYILPFWEALKWFCIQYLAFFIFFGWALNQVKLYIFQNYVVVTAIHCNE